MLFTTLGSLILTSLLTVGGMILGIAWERMIGLVEVYQDVVLVVLIITGIIFVGVRLRTLIRERGTTVSSK